MATNAALQDPIIPPWAVEAVQGARMPKGMKERMVGYTEKNTFPIIFMNKQEALSSLFDAAGKGDLDAARQALENGAPVNGRGIWNATPLMMAIYNVDVAMISLLKSSGARVNVIDEDHDHALSYVFNAKMAISSTGEQTPVTNDKRMDVLRALLLMGADKDARGDMAVPVLHLAAARFNASQICELLDLGMDATSVGSYDDRSFFHALSYNSSLSQTQATRVIRLALKKGADIDSRNHHGQTALDVAKREPETAASAVLLALEAAGAQPGKEPEVKRKSGLRR